MNTVKNFFSAATTLANQDNLPKPRPEIRKEDFPSIDKVIVGRMLAHVSIIPKEVSEVSLVCLGGDEQFIRSLQATVTGTTLRLEGAIPFTDKGLTQQTHGLQHGGAIIQIGGSSYGNITQMAYAGNVTVSSGNISYSRGGETTVIVDGREVDFARYIHIGVIVPVDTDLMVTGVLGAIGITDDLNGVLEVSASHPVELVARGVASAYVDITGSGRLAIGRIQQDARFEITGSGSVLAGSVEGQVNARVTGSGVAQVAGGTSRRIRGTVTGTGRLEHHGAIAGSTRLQLMGMGSLTVDDANPDDINVTVQGMGTARVNGQTYESQW